MPFFYDLSWNHLLKTHTPHFLNYWRHTSQKNIMWTGRAHCASREAVDLIFGPYSICHHKILCTWREGLEEGDVPTPSNRLGRTVLLYFYLRLMKKLWFWKKGHHWLPLPVPRSQHRTLPKAQWEPSMDPRFLLYILGRQNHRHLCCLARDRGQGKNLELLLWWPLTDPSPSLFTGQVLACSTVIHLTLKILLLYRQSKQLS